MLDEMIPFPIPLITPPVTRMYFIDGSDDEDDEDDEVRIIYKHEKKSCSGITLKDPKYNKDIKLSSVNLYSR